MFSYCQEHVLPLFLARTMQIGPATHVTELYSNKDNGQEPTGLSISGAFR